MSSNILNYYAKTNTDYLHSKGKEATTILMSFLDCKPNENILEIGFGTGATLVNFAALHQKSIFFGIEANPIMFQKGKKRVRFCGLKNITLGLNQNPLKISFSNNFFDKIYAESVLAILEGEDLKLMIAEIQRVLKPNGTLIINEGIWINTTSKDKINELNDFCKLNFGIIQSNSNYAYTSDWEKLLIEKGFEIEFIKRIDEIKFQKNKMEPNNFLSKLFSYFGKIQSKINPKLIISYSKFKNAMNTLAMENKYMDGFIIKCKAVK
jgi:ubiquinone/menaquinone biosynthesis C-methylase UbiE